MPIAKYEHTSLQHAQFIDVDLGNSRFDDVNRRGATFINVAFSGSTFSDVNLQNVSIDDANLVGMTIGGVLVVLTGSIWPALFAHASFVLFFMTQGSDTPATLRYKTTGVASR